MSEVNIDEHPHAHRDLWRAIGFALGVFSIMYGAGYAVQGNTYAVSPSLDVLKRIPGHMHTHGWLMLLLGIAMITEAARYDMFVKHLVVRFYCGYAVLVTVAIVGSWWTTNQITFSAPWGWIAFALISGAMIKFPPPPKRHDGGDYA